MDIKVKKRRTNRTCEMCGIKEAHLGEKMFFANYPIDKSRCREWVRLTGIEDLAQIPIEKLHTLKHICSRHFKKTDFNKKGNRLKKNSIPSLHLNSPLTDDQMSDFPLPFWKSTQVTLLPKESSTIAGPVDIEASGVKQKIENEASTTPPKESSTPAALVEVESRGVKRKIKNEACTSLLKESSTPAARVDVEARGVERKTKKEATRLPKEASTTDAPIDVEARGVKRKIENEELTPRKKKLLQRLKKTKCTLNSLRKSAALIEKIDSPMLKELIYNSCKNEKKKPKGRRWTLKHKISCLAILKRSPKAYRYLSATMPLPTVKTLQNILKKVPIQPGICKSALKQLKKIAEMKEENDRICCLVFDEMAIKTRLIYNEGNDLVEGYEDLGEFGRTNEIADHVLVFMLQGLRRKFKQPIAFYFTKGTISSAKLAMIIKKIVNEVSECGLTILSTVCDQGPTNMGAIKILRESSGPLEDGANNYFNIGNRKVYIMFDIPHLFKSIRNNFLNAGTITMNKKKGKWEHLVEVERHNRNFLYLSKISEGHITLKYRAKMKVKLAAQLLSNTVAAVLKLLARAENEEKKVELLETANIIEELDQLFDITNGPSGPQDVKKNKRQNVSLKSTHLDRWAHYIKVLEDTKFINKSGQVSRNVKCIEGYITSLRSLRDIWLTVKKLGFKYLNLRNLNQDGLENLFGVIRQQSPTNRNPTAAHFISALKTAVITGLTAPHSRGANCENDHKRLLTDFHDLVFGDKKDDDKDVHKCDGKTEFDTTTTNVQNISEDDFPVLALPDEEEILQNDFTLISEQPTVYVAGYLACQLLKKTNCVECKGYLTVEDPTMNPMYAYILLREWWQNKFSLTYPSLNFCKTVQTLIDTTEKELLPLLHERDICVLGCTLYNVHTENMFFPCIAHGNELKEMCFKTTCKLLIRRQCQIVNRNFASKEENLANLNKLGEQQGKTK